MGNISIGNSNRTKRILSVVMLLFAFSAMLAGCGEENRQQAEAAGAFCLTTGQGFKEASETLSVRAAEEKKVQEKVEDAQGETENAVQKEPVFVETPKLPEKGRKLSDFVPEGWELADSVELDFNEDKITDYVGVLSVTIIWNEDEGFLLEYWNCPRILFAVESCEDGSYRLSFQDENLIRNRDEGGIYGDPYLPLTAEGDAFTTHAYGGSAWRWSEDYTYRYIDGTWYFTKFEEASGYYSYITSYAANDWERGTGIRKVRNDESDYMEEHWEEEPVFDLVYEVSLDEMPTLYQAGKRWWLAPDRVTDWTVNAVTFAEDVAGMEETEKLRLSEAIKAYAERQQGSSSDYNDENGILLNPYSDSDNSKEYLLMYSWEDKRVSVLAESDTAIDDLEWYQGKIYYTTEIVENITYKALRDGKETLIQEEDTVGLILHRMNEDGSEKEEVFEYRYVAEGQEVLEERPPYLAFIYEVSGGEIILHIYTDGPHPYYRMNIDGSNVRKIGQVPA
ncbi:MAG: DUF5050 domain-containing protein [Bacteroidales bacterium]|nr:DUF5050 domain-containing protein [Lachnoclostridium sp.]MCM1383039.1 DUF5050 domain-containing protein [Lachnoclostridium sp.]MCM1463906.1 DUF5050 domain-containing protein [Bacteroidales bacterium]